MKIEDNQHEDTSDLRLKAETIVREQSHTMAEDKSIPSPEEIRKTIHELQVHQIELEMQNEELRSAQVKIEAGRALYLDLYDFSPVGYCTLSKQGLILEINLTATVMLDKVRSRLIK